MRGIVFLAFLSSVKICPSTQFVKNQHQPTSASNCSHTEYLPPNQGDSHGYQYGHHHGHHHDHNRYQQHISGTESKNPDIQHVANNNRSPAGDDHGPKTHNLYSDLDVRFNNSTTHNVRRHASSSSLERTKKVYDDMVYPGDEAAASMEFQTRVKAPSVSSRNCTYGICDEVDNYPAEKIARIISRSREFKQYFEEMAENKIDINNRFGGEGDTMCPTMTHTKFPQSARNTNNIQMLLVNVGDYKQGIFYETCLSDGAACMYSDIFPDDYTTTCKQKYTVRRLMAVLKDSDKAIFDNFELPSCCVCMIKKP